MTEQGRRPLIVAVAAVLVFEAIALLAVVTGVATLGYDLEAYARAAHRVLDGVPLYDASLTEAGAFASYLYPPPFALALVPLALLPAQVGLWQWEALTIGSLVAGVAILPVRPNVRLAILAVSAISWPVIYAITLGQVGPMLFLIFAIGWRWRDRAGPLGLVIAAGTLIKVQPVILLAWAGATGRWRAVAIALGGIAVAAVLSTLVFGPTIWTDYLSLLGRISAAVTTPHNFSPGGVVYEFGAPRGVAESVQAVSFVAVVAVVVIATLTASHEVSYLTAVVATQLLSPILWDHYALILLLPTAWLVDRGHYWALAIPLLTSLPVIVFMPIAIYPVLFGVGLVAPVLVEAVERRRSTRSGRVLPAVPA
jgi:hypothetical protein